jgi:hypothetical protein
MMLWWVHGSVVNAYPLRLNFPRAIAGRSLCNPTTTLEHIENKRKYDMLCMGLDVIERYA